MWIRIEMVPLDPDPYRYWEYRSGFRTVKIMYKHEKKSVKICENCTGTCRRRGICVLPTGRIQKVPRGEVKKSLR